MRLGGNGDTSSNKNRTGVAEGKKNEMAIRARTTQWKGRGRETDVYEAREEEGGMGGQGHDGTSTDLVTPCQANTNTGDMMMKGLNEDRTRKKSQAWASSGPR